MPEGWFTGDASGGSAGSAPPLHGRGAVSIVSNSFSFSLGTATATGDTIFVCGYTSAGTPSAISISGLGATWTTGNQGPFWYAIGTSPTAGLTTISISYPFSNTFVLLAASYGSLGALAQHVTNGAIGVSDVDVAFGVTPDPGPGQAAIIGWAIYSGVTAGATTSFTDTNGTYATVTAEVSSGVVVEIAAAAIPTSGPTDHVGHRPDTTTHAGGAFIFGSTSPAVFEGWS